MYCGARPSAPPFVGAPGFLSSRDTVLTEVASGTERSYSRDGMLGFPILWFHDGGLLNVVMGGERQYWYRIDLHSGEFQRLAENHGNPAYDTHFNVKILSPDGRTLYFGTYVPDLPGGGDRALDRIVALDLTGGVSRDVFRLPGVRANLPRAAQEWTLAVSPDGKTLAMTHVDPQAEMARLATVASRRQRRGGDGTIAGTLERVAAGDRNEVDCAAGLMGAFSAPTAA